MRCRRAQLEALSRYGEHIGLAFQVVDDILDVEQTSEQLGKTAGKDAQQHKITFPAVYGLERSHEMAEEQRLEAHLALRRFDDRAERLREIADLSSAALHDRKTAQAPHRPAVGGSRSRGIARTREGPADRRIRHGKRAANR